MKENKQLSIVIPTFNRAEFLDRCLSILIPSAEKNNIVIYISDNCSSDDTRSVVSRWISKYPLIKYFCNAENIGPDLNFEAALKMPTTNYVWLLGDTYHIQSKSIDFLVDLLVHESKKFDVFVFNVANRVVDIPDCDYSNKDRLLADLGWHMTCMSSLVYGREIILNANFNRYRESNFIQTGIIFEYIEDKVFLIKWINSHSVLQIFLDGVIKNSWQALTFSIWTERWSNFICSLPPAYDFSVKLLCIKNHGLKSGLFSLRNLLLLREEGVLNVDVYKRFSDFFPLTISLRPSVVLIVSLIPRSFLKLVGLFYRKLK